MKQEHEVSVVAGDFNFVPSNSAKDNQYHELFKTIGFDMSWTAVGIDPAKNNTYNALVPEDQGNGEVIDHIMYNPSKIKALDGGIIEMEAPLSDHKPVWALLELK